MTATVSNLGETRQRKRRRTDDPMRAFDALPPPLRRWLSEAALPWSPKSCRRIWQRARQDGETVEAVIARLDRAQAACLTRETPPRPARRPGERRASGQNHANPTGPVVSKLH
ncbi:DUF6525 family protein [Rhodobacteraceae bacterium KMM 6894]|nr:DUF6525 family protein [Rhodobacteraceae bacterium KMM 6894]